MDKIIRIIQKKPAGVVVVHLVYFLLIGFVKWRLAPLFPTLFFFIGAVLGMYLLNIAEEFFNLSPSQARDYSSSKARDYSPSPFRSIVFVVGFVLVSFFVVTSTGSMLGTGLVLSLYLTLLFWQLSEWKEKGNLDRWYSMISGSLSRDGQRMVLGGFILFFVVETILFLR